MAFRVVKNAVHRSLRWRMCYWGSSILCQYRTTTFRLRTHRRHWLDPESLDTFVGGCVHASPASAHATTGESAASRKYALHDPVLCRRYLYCAWKSSTIRDKTVNRHCIHVRRKELCIITKYTTKCAKLQVSIVDIVMKRGPDEAISSPLPFLPFY